MTAAPPRDGADVDDPLRRRVEALLQVEVFSPATLDLRISADPRAHQVDDELLVTGPRGPITPTALYVAGEGLTHRFVAEPGSLRISYRAEVASSAAAPPVLAEDEMVYLRPSRYAESDRIHAVAHAEFAGIDDRAALLAAVSSWVGGHLSYVPGSSRPTDGAVATLLQRSGVCRDYAHLVVALLRALDVPARLAAVYAPGLDPMDFHAVAEAAVDGVWRAVDATLLAPRRSLVRICTGRDAADTAFLSVYGGAADLRSLEVLAIVDGALPSDQVQDLVSVS